MICLHKCCQEKCAQIYPAITHRRKLNYMASHVLAHVECNYLCFIFVAPTACLSHAFVYNAGDANKPFHIQALPLPVPPIMYK